MTKPKAGPEAMTKLYQRKNRRPLFGTEVFIGPIEVIDRLSLRAGDNVNPVIGGSEFYFINLAVQLSALGAKVNLICLGSKLDLSGSKVKVLSKLPSLDKLSKSRKLLISSTSSYRKFFTALNCFQPLVLVSHHPHDGDLLYILRRRKDFILVNLGEYQFLSNKRFGLCSIIIPSFVAPPSKNLSRDVVPGLIGHVSSLVPSKGFHHIARYWEDISKEYPAIQLEVIGGNSLYGMPEEHWFIPTSFKYGNKIEKLLGHSGSENRIKFLGRVSGNLDRWISRWNLVVLNPRGIGEADPATMKECIRLGVPVIASYDFGFRAYLRDFPEFRLKSPRHLSRVVPRALNHLQKNENILVRWRQVYERLYQQNIKISESWICLIQGVIRRRNLREIAKELMLQFEFQEKFIFRTRINIRSFIWFPLFRFSEILRRNFRSRLLNFRNEVL